VRSHVRYDESYDALLRHRLVLADAAPDGTLPAPPRRRRRAELWNLEKSVRWAPRAASGFYEGAVMLPSLFDADWRVACASHGLGWFITRHYYDQAARAKLDRSKPDPGVGKVREVLRAHARALYNTFDYLSVLHSEATNSAGVSAAATSRAHWPLSAPVRSTAPAAAERISHFVHACAHCCLHALAP
jgi:hypothetical protein